MMEVTVVKIHAKMVLMNAAYTLPLTARIHLSLQRPLLLLNHPSMISIPTVLLKTQNGLAMAGVIPTETTTRRRVAMTEVTAVKIHALVMARLSAE
jgi:hypothetical protein